VLSSGAAKAPAAEAEQAAADLCGAAPHASCPCAAARGLEYYRESASASNALSGYYATIGQIDEVGGWVGGWVGQRGVVHCSARGV
jgi:hypothetical protein